jgi:hypothetical protein
MQIRSLAFLLVGSLVLTGCTRWEPQQGTGPVVFDRACPLRRAPQVATIGVAGVRGVYHFAVGGASDAERGAFLHAAEAGGFRVALVTININGTDTLFAWGRAVLHDQRSVDREFRAACGLGAGRIYLTHVRHNPPGRPGEEQQVR